MTAQSSVHFFLTWAKERIDEMDATLASLEGKAASMKADARVKADQCIAGLRKKRDEFESTARKQAEAGDAAWDATKVRLESEWKGFQSEIKQYLDSMGKNMEQQQAVFESQVTAQLNAWRETADKLNAAAKDLKIERRREIDATVARMKADATAAEEKLQKLAQAGTESWSAMTAALAETRGVFDRANQAAREAFNRAASSAQ
jgi:hypothetical protein